MSKIGLLGGTFDPVHLGHVHLASGVLEATHLEEIWFCPAHQNPLKMHRQPTEDEHRLAMIRMATGEMANVRVIENELRREGPSYMVDTLKELKAEFPHHQLTLIVGDDAAADFTKWKAPEEILQLSDVYVTQRHPQPIPIPNMISRCRIDVPQDNISSTEIRQRLSQGLPCDHLLPSPVLSYIHTHHLYTHPNR